MASQPRVPVACAVARIQIGYEIEAALKRAARDGSQSASLRSEEELLRQLLVWCHVLGARSASSHNKDLRQCRLCVTLSGYARGQ